MRKAAKDLKDMAKERVRLNEEAKRFVEGRKKLNACLQKMVMLCLYYYFF